MSNGMPRFRPGSRLVRRKDADAYREGRQYLDAAIKQVQEWRTKAAEASEKQKQAGYEAGLAEGQAAAARLVAETHQKADAHLTELEPKVEQLLLQLVERIVGTFEGKALILRLARQGLHRLRHEDRLRVLVAPEMVAGVQAEIHAVVAEEAPGTLVTVEPDLTLGPSDCVLASPLGYLRLGIADQLEALRQGLADRSTASAP